MELTTLLPILLAAAWLLPLGSFALIVLFGPRMGRAGQGAGALAVGAIGLSLLLSLIALAAWITHYPLPSTKHHHEHTAAQETVPNGTGQQEAEHHGPSSAGDTHETTAQQTTGHAVARPQPIAGDWYSLGRFGRLELTIGYYIDGLTIAMFCMVTLIATCIHVYSFGYMHEELHPVTDSMVTCSDGQPLRRRGRFHRFFQYMSLFCFSMLGLVIAGNIAMVFVFWELVGICSYLLIGFYIERRSASNAANKAFIVNRVGDFGMIVGLMAVWTGMGTFSFADVTDATGRIVQPGIFSQVRPAAADHQLTVPDGMVRFAAQKEIAQIVATSANTTEAQQQIAAQLGTWRDQGYGYTLLVVAGLGIFCGCVGKSAQFPLHVWLPDAMEGPTPVSALIHAATMVAAGVYLVGRFYPVFAPEVLLVIAYAGCITLFMAATIAITATDIKRVLAYSTVSQLGYMMLALGVGGWLAGIFHLFTHAFFKSLLFLCSGSVIHACGTNEMPEMGGLRKKMPITAYTMLVGCLAISGAGIPLLIGLSGYYSKDYIIAQTLSFHWHNPMHSGLLFYPAVLGAAITAFYMFRLWYLTFVGEPRNEHVAKHAHESPREMTVPLMILAAFAVGVAWSIPGVGMEPLLEQSRPLGIAEGASVLHPAEHLIHQPDIHTQATWIAFFAAVLGFVAATLFYGTRKLDPADVRKTFAPIHRFLWHKWWFDELYEWLFIRPLLVVSGWVAALDRRGIDWLVDGSAKLVAWIARLDDHFDRLFIDGLVNRVAEVTYSTGLRLRTVQTGRLQHYVLWIAVGTVGLFVLVSLYWNYTIPGG